MAKPTKAFLNQLSNQISILNCLNEGMQMSEVIFNQAGNPAKFDAEGNLQELAVEAATSSLRHMQVCSVGTMMRNLTRLQAKLTEAAPKTATKARKAKAKRAR